MRRAILILFFLILIAAAGLTAYAYLAEPASPGAEMTAPAAGVGFSD